MGPHDVEVHINRVPASHVQHSGSSDSEDLVCAFDRDIVRLGRKQGQPHGTPLDP
jgi:hypothetical protein